MPYRQSSKAARYAKTGLHGRSLHPFQQRTRGEGWKANGTLRSGKAPYTNKGGAHHTPEEIATHRRLKRGHVRATDIGYARDRARRRDERMRAARRDVSIKSYSDAPRPGFGRDAKHGYSDATRRELW